MSRLLWRYIIGEGLYSRLCAFVNQVGWWQYRGRGSPRSQKKVNEWLSRQPKHVTVQSFCRLDITSGYAVVLIRLGYGYA